MNAGLAKPIHTIWFIRASAVDLNQSLAAALFVGLPPWLRDHPPLLDRTENCCDAQSKNSNARPLFGRLSTKAFDIGDGSVADEIDDAVIGERRAL
jgi:hypothetical protein